ncbi:hypothetical protein TRIUR3_07060 [Triticum urartu]|uniref:Bifunctional inhibitor/plant lipid transfer protein/seed storage helical domain-containing protein n=2 Tax=Triticum TaxID=4564 RepID=A0A9R1RBT3_TRITD|nr:hypothetical protein TRIUR3_07060 [Triticum urartu]VAH35594.1 unnamed protein product [Triticum turgidum subsp. durum]
MDLRALAFAATVLLALAAPAPVLGQGVATSCTASLITSFTPCLSFLTNSTNGGGANDAGVAGTTVRDHRDDAAG